MAISQVPIENLFSKNFGGTSRGTLDSARKGYFFVFFLELPTFLTDVESNPFPDVMSMQKYLTATTMNIDGFDITVNKETSEGVGNSKYSEVTGVDYGDSISTTHKEFKGLPMSKLFHSWVRLMSDYRTAGRHYTTGENNQQSSYKSTILHVNLESDWETISSAIMYTGCFPDKSPLSNHMNQDITATDKVADISMSWNVDGFFPSWDYPKVLDTADKWMTTMRDAIERTRSGDFNGPTF